MHKGWLWSGMVLLLVATMISGCVDISCATWEPGAGTPSGPAGTTATTSAAGPTATSLPVTTTPSVTTPTTMAPTTTTTMLTTTTTMHTTTTLGPVDAYKAAMRKWKNTYAADMARYYDMISGMKNPLRPTAQEVQAAQDLDALLGTMVGELERIKPPARYANPHADYLASMNDLAVGVHELAVALTQGKSYQIIKAIADIAVTWQDGEPARIALERALGFSLSSQD